MVHPLSFSLYGVTLPLYIYKYVVRVLSCFGFYCPLERRSTWKRSNVSKQSRKINVMTRALRDKRVIFRHTRNSYTTNTLMLYTRTCCFFFFEYRASPICKLESMKEKISKLEGWMKNVGLRGSLEPWKPWRTFKEARWRNFRAGAITWQSREARQQNREPS